MKDKRPSFIEQKSASHARASFRAPLLGLTLILQIASIGTSAESTRQEKTKTLASNPAGKLSQTDRIPSPRPCKQNLKTQRLSVENVAAYMSQFSTADEAIRSEPHFKDWAAARAFFHEIIRLEFSPGAARLPYWKLSQGGAEVSVDAIEDKRNEKGGRTIRADSSYIAKHLPEILSESKEKPLYVSGNHVYLGTIMTDSPFSQWGKSDIKVTREQLEYVLAAQSFMIIHKDGSLQYKYQGLEQHLFAQLQAARAGRPVDYFRGQSELDYLTIKFLQAMPFPDKKTLLAHRKDILKALMPEEHTFPIMIPVLESAKQKIEASEDALAIAKILVEEVKRVPVLFGTNDSSWSKYFTRGKNKAYHFHLFLDRLSERARKGFHIGVDGYGSPPYSVEFGLPFATLEEATDSVRAIQLVK